MISGSTQPVRAVADLNDPANSLASAVAATISLARFTASCENDLQLGVQQILVEAHPGRFQREFTLDRYARPDFFCPETGIVIEIKWRPSGGSVSAVLSQLSRYATDPRVRAIVIASPSLRVLSQLPDFVCDVPLHRARLITGL
jgi:hypothetical protein